MAGDATSFLRRRWAVLVAVGLLAAACGGGGGEDDAGDDQGGSEEAEATVGTVAPPGAEPEASPQLPVTVDGADGERVTVTDVSRIIPVNGDIAEVVFALGLGDNVVATDLSATYPPEADALPEVGYQRTLIAEQVLGMDPTVVVGDLLAGPPGVLDQLRDAGIPVVIVDFPHDLSGPAAKARLVGEALGVPARGEALARQVDAEVEAARADAAERVEAGGERPRVAFLYLRGETVQNVAGQGSGIDALLDAAGAVDIGTEMGVDDFEPITTEAFVAARPDALVVTTTGLASVGGVDGLVALDAVSATPAGEARRVVALDDQLVLGLGPRTGQALEALVDALHPDPDSDSDADSDDSTQETTG